MCHGGDGYTKGHWNERVASGKQQLERRALEMARRGACDNVTVGFCGEGKKRGDTIWVSIGLCAIGEEKRRMRALSLACLGRRIRGPILGSNWIAANNSIPLRRPLGWVAGVLLYIRTQRDTRGAFASDRFR
jgi:hypothetical protein